LTDDDVCLDSIRGIATHYGLDDPGIKSQCQQDSQHPTRPALGPTQPPVQWILCLFPGVKWPQHGTDHILPSNAKIGERMELHLYTPSGPTWTVLG